MTNRIQKVQLINSEDGDWVVLKLNGKIYEQGHSIPEMTWLELISNLGAYVMHKTVSKEDMEEGKY